MTIIFQGDPNAKTYGFPDGVAAKDPSRYGQVADPLNLYPTVWHVQVRPGDNNVQGSGTGERCEGLITVGDLGPQVRGVEGRTLFFAWDVIYGDGYAANGSGWNNAGQWHNSGTTGATCAIITPNNAIDLNVAPGNGTNYDTYHLLPKLQTMRRYEWAFQWTWSTDKTKGAVAVWLDGEVCLPLFHTATLYPNQYTYPKLGNYRTAQSFVADLYHHGYRITTTLAEAVAAFSQGPNASKWAQIAGGVTPPPVNTHPIHDAVAQVSAASNPNIRHAFDLIADKIEP